MKSIVCALLALFLMSSVVLAVDIPNTATRGLPRYRPISLTDNWLYSSPDTSISDTVSITTSTAVIDQGRKVILAWTLARDEYAIVRDLAVGSCISGQNMQVELGVSIGGNTGKARTVAAVVWNWHTKVNGFEILSGEVRSTFPKDYVIGPGPLRFELIVLQKRTVTLTSAVNIWYRAWVQFICPY